MYLFISLYRGIRSFSSLIPLSSKSEAFLQPLQDEKDSTRKPSICSSEAKVEEEVEEGGGWLREASSYSTKQTLSVYVGDQELHGNQDETL